MLLVHPDGLGSKATNEEINISFDPVPDYSGIAKAAAGGKLFAARVEKADALEDTLKAAIEAIEGGLSAVIGELNIELCFCFSPVFYHTQERDIHPTLAKELRPSTFFGLREC